MGSITTFVMSCSVPKVSQLTPDTHPELTEDGTQQKPRLAMVPCLLFTLLQVGEVMLNSFGPTERAYQTGTFTEVLDERLSQTTQDASNDEQATTNSMDYPDDHENLTCLIDPTNHITCSWTLHDLADDSKCHASICVSNSSNCDSGATECQQGSFMFEAVVGPGMCHMKGLDVKFTLRVPSADKLSLSSQHKAEDIQILSPPSNVTARVTGTDLIVQWSHPPACSTFLHCLDHQLDINDQVKELKKLQYLTYNESVDPTQSYNVRARVKWNEYCTGYETWSSWSPSITVGPPNQVNSVSGIVIALGIPMILLALMLLIRLQRDRLLPPIPGPPLKIKHLLEADNLFQFVPQPSKCIEEVTVVEEAEDIYQTD
ncbi:hypothetical protein DPEC_G00061320 [Dallia pectoralis]|uniref:Uncharacterized protein n=1 Tax=Dallia pectoralis TaxID=75939 RepID=A0ACC2H7A0_DALPE|nr:hypothetical protein DPEC_G00061320 [Dallia pectoralis]